MIETTNTRIDADASSLSAAPPRVAGAGRVGIRNSANSYGIVSIAFHWLVAVVVFGLFALGVWMTGLTYYDVWYKTGPYIHKSIGILLFFVMLARVVWRASNTAPDDEHNVGVVQRRLARSVHLLLYLLLFAMMISGYFISTADGRPIQVFDLFTVPATISGIPNQEDIAGKIHWYLALVLISLVVLHAGAALKHHFIDRDRTLKRMLGIRS